MDKTGKLKKAWQFFWKSDSPWSWLANVIIAFLVIYFIVYPVLGLLLGTSFPIVAVVSESMEHGLHNNVICGQQFDQFPESYDNYWDKCGEWYEERGISKEQFAQFPFRDGFRKGDVIILWRANQDNLELGDILVFQGNKPQPIIHRIIKVWEENGETFYQTKGDHNADSFEPIMETKIEQERVYGQGVLKIPYLGWLKILFVEAVKPLGINIQR
ncbi:MAG: signal peptidase I [Nanoarchaeota archaeon]|nr:signal peptidase I [Nanoarchaeota archaeon]MBU1622048.1 signal peptidase I [Nanoarchaeota archaeon]